MRDHHPFAALAGPLGLACSPLARTDVQPLFCLVFVPPLKKVKKQTRVLQQSPHVGAIRLRAEGVKKACEKAIWAFPKIKDTFLGGVPEMRILAVWGLYFCQKPYLAEAQIRNGLP